MKKFRATKEYLLFNYCRWNEPDRVTEFLKKERDIDLTYDDGIHLAFAIKHKNTKMLNALMEYFEQTKLQGDTNSMEYKTALHTLKKILQQAVNMFKASPEIQEILDKYIPEDDSSDDEAKLTESEHSSGDKHQLADLGRMFDKNYPHSYNDIRKEGQKFLGLLDPIKDNPHLKELQIKKITLPSERYQTDLTSFLKDIEPQSPYLLDYDSNKTDLEELLRKDADVNAAGKYGKTPLHIAADKYGRTPLHIAAQQGYLDVVQELLSKDADVKAADKYGRTPLNCAANKGHRKVVELLLPLDKGANIDAPNQNGRTPLHFAANKGHLKFVKLLLDKGANIEITDKDGNTPLLLAIQNGHLGIVNALLAKGANVDTINKDGNTPLHFAFIINSLIELMEPTEGMDMKLIKQPRESELKDIGEKYVISIIDQLLENKPNYNIKNNDGNTPLHLAVQNNKTQTVKFLLNKGAKVDATNNSHDTPLDLALKNSQIEIAKLLVPKEVHLEESPEFLSSAIQKGDLDTIALYILEKVSSFNTQAGYDEYVSLLHLAKEQGQSEALKILSYAAYLKIDDTGLTLLHLSARKGDLNTVTLLLDKDISFDTPDHNGDTPFYYAAEGGEVKIMELLLEKGTQINSQDQHGVTPLHWAAGHQSIEAVKWLLSKGAAANARDNASKTPLDYARKGKISKEIIQLLQKAQDTAHSEDKEPISSKLDIQASLETNPQCVDKYKMISDEVEKHSQSHFQAENITIDDMGGIAGGGISIQAVGIIGEETSNTVEH